MKFIFVLVTLTYTSLCFAKPVALIVHIDDGTDAVDEDDLDFTREFLKAGLPRHKVKDVVAHLAYKMMTSSMKSQQNKVLVNRYKKKYKKRMR